MLKWIFDSYYDPTGPYTVIRVFQYITFRAALSAVLGFGLCILCMPAVIRWCRRSLFQAGLKEDVPFHAKKAGTPTLGGAVIVAATLVAALLCADLSNRFVQMILLVLVQGMGRHFNEDVFATGFSHAG